MDAPQRDDWHAPRDSAPLPVAVLRHAQPDGGVHFDLLLAMRAPAGPDDRCAACWRCAAPADALEAGEATAAEQIGDHRALYLTLDVPRQLGEDRGAVAPVARGEWVLGDGVAASAAGAAGAAGSADESVPLTTEIRWSDGRRVVLQIHGGWLRRLRV